MVLEHTDITTAAKAPASAAQKTLSIAMVGTRGVPAAYGGFETAIEEVGRRLVDRGHRVTVYTRGSETRERTYLGMDLVHLPALHQKQLETLSHTGLSTLHTVLGRRPDAAFVFNAANAPFLPLLRARGIPTALHMDGLEWKRSKWGARGKAYYRWAEEFGVRTADALISDAPGIAEYYTHQFGVPTELIRYGAPILGEMPDEGVRGLGLEPAGYHLVVARFEPENHVLEIVEGYRRSTARMPLVVVGSAPYSAEYTRLVRDAAADDPRIVFLGGVYDQDLLDALYAHAYTYVHGHSVGGTNPSLLRAMGAGAAVVAYDVTFNREVLDSQGWFFESARDLTALLAGVEADAERVAQLGLSARERASEVFRWDRVTDDYEALARRLAEGRSVHDVARRARRASGAWSSQPSHHAAR
jgi:glycosyltransferase involved in cell wall biosynthesis